ncbi:hypothetical protein NQ318_018410 [Aromia moschata]|uniref:Uncharacterized protein n=1 Tax=Aromia moschata TaxID=1265417 RepID=A0AAV8XAH6_9CUCU|nr:hypothetical protein NQ318_018410 [Aromia moschata]
MYILSLVSFRNTDCLRCLSCRPCVVGHFPDPSHYPAAGTGRHVRYQQGRDKSCCRPAPPAGHLDPLSDQQMSVFTTSSPDASISEYPSPVAGLVLVLQNALRKHKAFAEGREDVNDENRAGRPSTSSSDDNVKRVRDLLNIDRRLSVRLISETLDITKTIVHEIVSESLGMRKVCAKLVPKVLTDYQKARRVETCQELLDTCEDNPAFLDHLSMVDCNGVARQAVTSNPQKKMSVGDNQGTKDLDGARVLLPDCFSTFSLLRN